MIGTTKKKPQSRISRNKKAYWRKGVNLNDVENYLNAKYYDEIAGGPIEERPDEELFAIDVKQEGESKLTRRQQAALKKRDLLINGEEESSVQKPSKRKLKRTLRSDRKVRLAKQLVSSEEEKKTASKSSLQDIWEDDEESSSPLKEYYERAIKKKLPNRPSTLNHKSTILPKVDVPSAATSYNPQNDVYNAYLTDIANDELLHEVKEKKLASYFTLPPGEHYVTKEERFLEESAGLIPENVFEFGDEDEEDKETFPKEKKEMKRKTRKSVRRKLLEKKKLLEIRKRKARKAEESLVFSSKKLRKEITAKMLEQERKAKMRKAKKVIKKLTHPCNHKRFIDVDKEFLLPDELPNSLLKLKPQGSILADRRKSLQKRNILPLGGQKQRRKLKKRLRVKISEKRSHKDVTVGSHLKK